MRYLLDQLLLENREIEKSHPSLETRGNFSKAGIVHFNNLDKIHRLKLIGVRLVTGGCECDSRIERREQNIYYCAWCHKEIHKQEKE